MFSRIHQCSIFGLLIALAKSQTNGKLIMYQLRNVISIISALFLGSLAHAGPYSFSGACSVQGTWTQQALAQSIQLREFVEKIKDDPNCNAISGAVGTLADNLEDTLATSKNIPHASSIPFEIQALRTFSAGDGAFKGSVLKTMMSKIIQMGQATASKAAEIGKLPPSAINKSQADQGLNSIVDSLNQMETRAFNTVNTGLVSLNNLAEILPQATQCLASPGSHNGLGGVLLHTMINTAAAYAGSGFSTSGVELSRFLNTWNSVARNSIFADALKTLNQAEYQNSLSCLLEVASENYCSTRDANMLYQQNINMYRSVRNQQKAYLLESKSKSDRAIQNPLLGYIVLAQHIPIVTSWVQRVQIGVDPKLVTDAQFQSNIMQTTQAFYSGVKFVQGEYSQNVLTLSNQSDITQKRKALITLLIKLKNAILASHGPTDNINFFTMGDDMSVMFDLLGIPVPKVVKGTDGGTPQSPETWIQANWKTIDDFNDPEKCAENIGVRLSDIIQRGERAAIDYYSKWFIIDKVALLNQSFLGPSYNVKESFILIDQYLAELQGRLNQYPTDPSVLAGVLQTRAKISRVLDAYFKYEDLAEQLKHRPFTEDDILLIAKSAEFVIKTVYQEFEVLLARSSLLANRLRDFVEYDYTQMIRLKTEFNDFYEELFYSTGRMMFDRMITLGANDDAKLGFDLAEAMRLQKENLKSIEEFAAADLVRMMAYTKMISENRQPTTSDVAFDSFKRVFKDYYVSMPNAILRGGQTVPDMREESGVWHTVSSIIPRALKGAFATAVDIIYDPFFDLRVNSRYPMPFFDSVGKIQIPAHIDDEFGSAKKVLAELCVKSLAFVNIRGFWNLCRDTILQSPYNDPDFLAAKENQELANSIKGSNLRDYLSIGYATKAYERLDDPKLNDSLRICAFRDFNRRNFVVKQTMNMRLIDQPNETPHSTANGNEANQPPNRPLRYRPMTISPSTESKP